VPAGTQSMPPCRNHAQAARRAFTCPPGLSACLCSPAAGCPASRRIPSPNLLLPTGRTSAGTHASVSRFPRSTLVASAAPPGASRDATPDPAARTQSHPPCPRPFHWWRRRAGGIRSQARHEFGARRRPPLALRDRLLAAGGARPGNAAQPAPRTSPRIRASAQAAQPRRLKRVGALTARSELYPNPAMAAGSRTFCS
jgi:hypothetical protein